MRPDVLPDDDGTLPIPPAFRIYLHRGTAPAGSHILAGMAENPLPYSVQERPGGSVILKINLRDEATSDAASRNAVELSVKSRVLATVEDFRQKHGRDWIFAGLPAILPIREMRRIRGEYVLRADDVRSGRQFDDAIARGSFIIDTLRHHEPVPPYDIPYRSILVPGISNLLVVGRCFSADRYAMASARIMKTVSQMGEAAGAAAALSVQKNLPLKDITAGEITALLQSVFA